MNNKQLISVYKNFCHHLSNNCVDIYTSNKLPGENSSSYYEKVISNNVDILQKLKTHFQDVDFTSFNKSELEELGCSMWDENLILCPKWIIVCSKDGTNFVSINGGVETKGIDELDLDTRFGKTAYGFLLSDLRDSKINEFLS